MRIHQFHAGVLTVHLLNTVDVLLKSTIAATEQTMTGTRNRMQQKSAWIFVLSALILMVSSVYAFDLPDFKLPSFKYGKLKRDREVNLLFQTYKILPDHKYYTVGHGSIPHAILGIQENYKLRPGIWKPVEVTVPLLRSWVSKMDNIYGYPPYGCRVYNDENQRIGIWYSSKQWTTIIIEENNEIAVLAPEPPGFGRDR